MRIWLAFILALMSATIAAAQTRSVNPDDLRLELQVEALPATPYRQEMILLTIHGIYKRHITREQLIQPDFEGFSWMQLGEDFWYESLIDGLPVKNMRRRMAIFPDKSGTLEVGRFQHTLTLLDEDNKWFEHTISSDPLSIEVQAQPKRDDWWFPVRGLKVTDDWSNAPDQLNEGEGVLRVVRLSALGASPDMMPPMPELRSPSALIFAHPEKRLVELTPDGPRAIAFWRWTITPTNGRSAILEPITFSYFDTVARVDREVEISVQRVAFGDAIVAGTRPVTPPERQARLWPGRVVGAAVLAFGIGLALILRRRSVTFVPAQNWLIRWRVWRQLRRAAQRNDRRMLRRAAHALDALYEPEAARVALLRELDSALFGPTPQQWDAPGFACAYGASLRVPRRDFDLRKTPLNPATVE